MFKMQSVYGNFNKTQIWDLMCARYRTKKLISRANFYIISPSIKPIGSNKHKMAASLDISDVPSEIPLLMMVKLTDVTPSSRSKFYHWIAQ